VRVLIADDLVLITEVLARLFYRNGHQAFVCTNGQEVLDALEPTRPDVLFLDIAMPCVDGLQVAEQLKQRPELRPPLLVALTGYSDPVMTRKIKEAGFDRHLVKPVGWAELSAVINPVLAVR